ncbi:MAG: DUF4114 domain-containing protein [bacterium]
MKSRGWIFLLLFFFSLPARAEKTIEHHSLDPAWLSEIQALFPPGKPVSPVLLDFNVDPNVHLFQDAELSVTFIDESAAYLNEFGYFLFEDANHDGKITEGEIIKKEVIFENASKEGDGGHLNNGDTVNLGKFPKGTHLGFYLFSNAFAPKNGGGLLGSTPQATFYTIDSLNPDGHRHLAMLARENQEEIILGIEDLPWDHSDRDFNDVVFTFTANPKSALKEVIEQGHIPTSTDVNPSVPPTPPAESHPAPESHPSTETHSCAESRPQPESSPASNLPATEQEGSSLPSVSTAALSTPPSFFLEGSGQGCAMAPVDSPVSKRKVLLSFVGWISFFTLLAYLRRQLTR